MKKKTYLSEPKKQALHISDEIEKLKLQLKQKEKAVKMMGDEFDKCFILMQENNDMIFVIGGIWLKNKLDKAK